MTMIASIVLGIMVIAACICLVQEFLDIVRPHKRNDEKSEDDSSL